jgi:hypothetical protein
MLFHGWVSNRSNGNGKYDQLDMQYIYNDVHSHQHMIHEFIDGLTSFDATSYFLVKKETTLLLSIAHVPRTVQIMILFE